MKYLCTWVLKVSKIIMYINIVNITNWNKYPEDIRINEIPDKPSHHVQIRDILRTHLKISVCDPLNLAYELKSIVFYLYMNLDRVLVYRFGCVCHLQHLQTNLKFGIHMQFIHDVCIKNYIHINTKVDYTNNSRKLFFSEKICYCFFFFS